MPHFFVNNAALPDGNHDLHVLGCAHMPSDKRYVGDFDNPGDALSEARKDFEQTTTCEKCGHRQVADSTTVRKRLPVSGIYSMLRKTT